jgi:hypothetical protein
MDKVQIAEYMGSMSSDAEVEAMLLVIHEHGYVVEYEQDISAIPDSKWSGMVAEAVALARL